ncbi:MAG: hypothetical protein OXK79_10190 [Chloroflexota bacterium]|nr:hypothetical protein [Chloroflexota bacterium]
MNLTSRPRTSPDVGKCRGLLLPLLLLLVACGWNGKSQADAVVETNPTAQAHIEAALAAVENARQLYIKVVEVERDVEKAALALVTVQVPYQNSYIRPQVSIVHVRHKIRRPLDLYVHSYRYSYRGYEANSEAERKAVDRAIEEETLLACIEQVILRYERILEEYYYGLQALRVALKRVGTAGLTDKYSLRVEEYKDILRAATERELDDRHIARCNYRWVPVFARRLCLPRPESQLYDEPNKP